MVQAPPPETQSVRQIFNDMAPEYDHLQDLWYRYSFSRINNIIRKRFARTGPGHPALVIDVGCGTGIQSLTFAELGYSVVGIDIAEDLLRIAEGKLNSRFPGRAAFFQGDAQNLPFGDSVADVINCCGSTLSLVPDFQQAIREMARVLKPGGRLILECEQKWNLDLLWEVINALLGNVFEYDESLAEALAHFLPPFRTSLSTRYAFCSELGNKSYMTLKLFTPQDLGKALAQAGFRVEHEFGIHFLTNLIPSPVLHDASPGQFIQRLFDLLRRAESGLWDQWPFRHLGCSLVVIATKL